MSGQIERKTKVDRRTTIKWLAATMAASASGCSSTDRFVGEEIPPVSQAALLGTAQGTDGVGIGIDPDLLHPVVPWRRTMTEAQLGLAAALADVVLPADDSSPAASALGVHEFVDEWVSAPYPRQQADRELVLAGLEQLERGSRERFGVSFRGATTLQQDQLVDDVAGSEFFARFRYLVVGAFYSTRDGIEDIGYVGNRPIAGEYPGPDAAAMAHLEAVLQALDLPA